VRREREIPAKDLKNVQHWLQAVIVHPGDVEDAVAAPDAAALVPPDALGEVIAPSRTMNPLERVDVYHGMYPLRMIEALGADYPAVSYFLGEEAFADLVMGYVQHYPSRSYTLNRLGDHFPDYLAGLADLPDHEFLADLARFELAITRVFDEEETPVLTAEALQAVAPDDWERAVLRPIAALRLLALRHPVVPHLKAFHHERPSPRPRRRASWVAVYRRDYSVYHLELSRAEHALLAALVSGHTLADALAEAFQRLRAGERQEKIFRWFRTWVAEGLFQSVEVSGS